MKRWWIIAAALVLMIGGFYQSNAQAQAIEGFITNLNGDLWAYDPATGTQTRLTEWGYNGPPHMSPTGDNVVYLSRSEESVNNPDMIFPGTPPTNIWLLNTVDGSFTQLVDQPGGMTLRSQPAWSPDGTRIAYAELTLPSTQEGGIPPARLMVYDLRTGQASVLNGNYDMGFQDGGIYMPPVKWGPGGLTRVLFTFNENGQPTQLFELYDPNTGALSTFLLSQANDMMSFNNFVQEHLWATDNAGQPRILLFMRESGWETFEPSTGVRAPLANSPQRVMSMGLASMRLTPIFQPQANDGYLWNWQVEVFYDGGQPGYTAQIGYTTHTITDTALPIVFNYSAAWADNNGSVYLWQDGAAQNPRIVMSRDDNNQRWGIGPMSVAWWPQAWSVDMNAAPPPTPAECTMPSRVGMGDFITVTPGEPNNVRAEPGTGRVVGQFNPGDDAQITAGPVCVDGIVWWGISNEGLGGWTAEGTNGEYWLQRTDYSPLPSNGCPPAHPTVFETGELVQVSPGPPNNWRAAPTLNSRVLGVFPAGTYLTILEGPVCADGINWYRVQFTEGTGWTAEGANGEYWLQPAG